MSNDEKRKNLTILSISPLSLWSQHLGGKENSGAQAIPLAQNGFTRSGHKATLLIIKGANYKTIGERTKEFYRGFSVHRIYIPKFLSLITQQKYLNYISLKFFYFWYYIFAFVYGLKIAREIKPDIVIGYTNYSTLPAYLIGRIMKIPYVYRENGSWALYDEVQTLYGRIKSFDIFWAFKLPCAAMILTDDGTRTDLIAKRFGVSSEKIYFWKNGVPKLHSRDLNRAGARQKLNLDGTRKILVSVGRLSADKRFDVIIKSLVKLKQDYLCIIIGNGPKRPFLRKLVDSFGLEKQVLFTGALPHSDIGDYLVAADLVIALGSINPLLEGMSAGRCVITLNLGSTYQMTNNGKAAIVIEEADSGRLGNYISDALADNDRRQEIERNALEWISTVFDTWEERIKKEVQLIENIAYEYNKNL